MIDITEQRLRTLKQLGFEPKKILDIGAYVGNWASMVQTIWPEAKIKMIEPNIDVAPAGAIQALLGKEMKEEVIYFVTKNEIATGNSIYLEQTSYFDNSEKRKMKMVTLDSLKLRADLIKIDTQGSELDILNGGEETVKEAEFVLLETQNLEYNSGAPKTLELMNKMDDLGFQLFDITQIHHLPTGEMMQVDMLFARKDSKLIKRGKLW